MDDEEESDDSGPCIQCGTDCSEDEYCIGCGNYICDDCGVRSAWEHALADHYVE